MRNHGSMCLYYPKAELNDLIHSADSKLFTRGDYLTATFCYCAYPPRMEAVMGPAHFYQFEYYNYRHDTTFILTSACPDGDIGFDRVCVPPSGGVKVLAGKTMDWNCKEWDGYEDMGDDGKAKRKDRLCYIPRFKHNVDYIRFNGQWRNLGAKGRQGPALRDMAPGTCENLCQENMGMPELQDDNYPPSHQIEWTNLDDMCHDCK